MPLTPKQAAFVSHYLALQPNADGSQLGARATNAARLAGYRGKGAGYQLMRRPDVLVEIERAQRDVVAVAAQDNPSPLDTREIVKQMVELTSTDLRDVMTVEGGVVRIHDSTQWSDAAARSIEAVDYNVDRQGNPRISIRRTRRVDVLRALGQFSDMMREQRATDRLLAVFEDVPPADLREFVGELFRRRREIASGGK